MSKSETEERRLRAELAGLIFEATLLRAALIERKGGYDPNQPRDGATGRWADGMAGAAGRMTAGIRRAYDRLPPQVREPVEALAGAAQHTMEEVGQAVSASASMVGEAADDVLRMAPPPVRAFLDRNRDAINRTLGALQMAGGVGEVVGGGAVIADSGGVAAAAGAWMVAHGADDWDTGLRMLVSGELQETSLGQALQRFGFSREASDGLVAATAGLAPSVAIRMPRQAVEAAASRVLQRDALDAFTARPLALTEDGRFWNNPNISARGSQWEVFDNATSGLELTPAGFRTFDQRSADGTIAASNKALDLVRESYLDLTRQRVYSKLKKYIDDAATF